MRKLNKDDLDKILEYVVNRFGFDTWWYNYLVKFVMNKGHENEPLIDDIELGIETARDKTDILY